MNSKVRLLVQLLFCLSAVFCRTPASAQHRETIYQADSTNFPNPERGIYHHKEVRSSNYNPLTFTELVSFREHGVTLVMRVFYLENFVDSDISKDYLENVDKDFSTARSAGVKLLVRFAYTQSMTKPYGDAKPERVMAHIDQLTPVLRKNSDVIALVQAGFIGGWGEWFYTDHFSQVAGFNNPQNWADRKALVEALLNALPVTRTVQLRTPAYKRTLTGISEPLDSAEAFSGSMRSRIGHHNDCFLASHNDLGTYVDIDEEKAYIEQETYFVPLGGETCGVYVPKSECPNALMEMERLHWSYLNEDYHPLVISGFESNGCMPEIRKLLGYRFRLLKSNIQEVSKPGGEFQISFELVNDGWAPPFNPRDVEIVLTHVDNQHEYFFKLSADPRRWLPNDTIRLNEIIGVPDDFLPGNYHVSLHLPDPEPSLSGNPLFSIRFANKNIWNSTNGYNAFGVEVDIDAQHEANDFSGTSYFVPRYVVDNTIALTDFYASSSHQEVMLYWPTRADGYYRVIERSVDGGEYQAIQTIPVSAVFFKDKNVVEGSVYNYRYRFVDGNRYSDYSSTTSVSLSEAQSDYPVFTLDGSADEWSTIEPLADRSEDGSNYFFRLFADRDSLNLLIEGESYTGYSLFLDTDNNTSSGIEETAWTETGFDYLIQDDALFKAENSAWQFVLSLKSIQQGNVREIKAPLNALINLGDNIIFKAGLALNLSDDVVHLPKVSQVPVTYVRSLPAPVPQAFSVSNSHADPEHRLVISWKTDCLNCDGFVLQRSPDGENNFETIFKTTSAALFRDDSLDVNSSYYYRLYAYNETGPSGFTPVMKGTTQQSVTGIFDEQFPIQVFPNPVKNRIFFSGTTEQFSVEVRSSTGLLYHEEMVDSFKSSEASIDVSGFPKGFYLLRIVMQQGNRSNVFKIVKTE